MALIPHFDPVAPWHWAVAAALIAALVGVAAAGLRDGWRSFGRRGSVRALALTLSLIAALCLLLAAFNPSLAREPNAVGLHLVVVLDVSDSALRGGQWPERRARAAELVQAGLTAVDDEMMDRSSGSVVTFRDGASVVEVDALRDLPNEIRQLDEQNFAGGEGSDLAAGLERAGAQIQRSGGRGAVLLVSDGHQTAGDALGAARQLAAQGVAVHVLPMQGQGADLFIESADLPRQVHAQQPTYLRGVLRNERQAEAGAALRFLQSGDEPANASAAATDITLPWDRPGSLRHPLRFEGVGLQFVELALQPLDGAAGEQRRRFFIHVTRPLRLVAVGDASWQQAIPPDVATVHVVASGDFSAARDLKDADAVVVANVVANEFAQGELAALADAVQRRGVGFMLVNGDHAGREPDESTVLMSYKETPVEPLLPLSVEPRPFTPEPPPRQIIMLIDASGSMDGWPMGKAKQIARALIERHLRPVDRLDVLIFTTGAVHLVEDAAMDAAAKATTISRIDGVGAGGGTDPNRALALVAGRKYTNCGLFFISDLGFDVVKGRPECAATIFAIGASETPRNSPLLEYADPIPAPRSFDPASVEIHFFEPEPRDKFFEPGEFRPLPAGYGRDRLRLPVPELALDGAAITYAREDADLVAVRPRFTDPVLAYRAADAGYVGAFTSAWTGDWLETDEGRDALQAWITRLVAYVARDRYDFRLEDRGDDLALTVAITPRDGATPNVDALEARVELEDGSRVPVSLERDPAARGVFSGIIRLTRSDAIRAAALVLREFGADALPRPQRIPLMIPAAGEVAGVLPTESYSFGVNESLLRAVAGAGGGKFDPAPGASLAAGVRPAAPGTPLWPSLLAAAAVAYLASIAAPRLEP